jgi:4-hydroxybenzoate polyprenyltransferase
LNAITTYTALAARLKASLRFIFPPFISVVYTSLSHPFVAYQSWVIVFFILSAICISAFGYFLNDATDVKADQMAGKKNMASSFSVPIRMLIAGILLLGGSLFFYMAAPRPMVIVWLAAQVLALVTYSVPPFRFKNNPLIGPLLDAHYGHVLPVFMAVFVFFLPTEINQHHPLFLPMLYILLLLKGLRNILLHQLHDRKDDEQAGIYTFPVKFGPVFCLNCINRFFLPLETGLLIVLPLYFWPQSQLIIYGLIGFIGFYFLNFSAWKFFILPKRQLKFKFLFVLNDFYEYWLPYLCIWVTNLPTYQKCILTLVHSLVFYHGLIKLYKDLKKIGQNLGFSKVV